jgi:tRNA 2-selenouridine synthase
VSFPLFSDEERKQVGTTYKQVSREQAIKIGLDYFGPKMRTMVEQAEGLTQTQTAAPKTVLVHCWRGGMRSAAIAWLLDLYGFKVYLLQGGYKAYRQWVIAHWGKAYPFRIVGGYTGSGKTHVLEALRQYNQPVLDLEALAGHKGSAFGAIKGIAQPTQEMFENLLAGTLSNLLQTAAGKPVWVEDESQRIGDINIPPQLWQSFRDKPVYFLDVPFEERLQHIKEAYGRIDKEVLINAIMRIQKRLGPLETKTAINCLLENDIDGCFTQLLRYYDKQYTRALHSRENAASLTQQISCTGVQPDTNARKILNHFNAHATDIAGNNS